MYSFVFTYLSTRSFGEGEWATPHCKRQNVPSSQLTTKFARDEADKVKETSSSDKTGTTPLGRKHRARILPLSVTGHTRNRVPETRDKNVKTTVDCKAACIFACRSRTTESWYEGENGVRDWGEILSPHKPCVWRTLASRLKTDFEKTKPSILQSKRT